MNVIHLTFSTKYRAPVIIPPIADELYRYLGGICNGMECRVIIVGGYTDHVHILCQLSKKVALMDLVQEVKARSSRWIKTNGASLANFQWQNGYGAFSVNPSDVDIVRAYIERQHEHHAKKSFPAEYIEFLRRYNVNYDERYLWN